MTLSLNDDCDFEKKGRNATDRLLVLLKQQHDFDVPSQFVTKQQVIEICSSPEERLPVEICILPIPMGKLTVDGIKRVVCKHFGISHSEMISPRRDKKVQQPRMVAMFLARELTAHGFPTLGRYFHRDHTSIIHSVRKMEGMMGTDAPLVRDVSYLREVLGA